MFDAALRFFLQPLEPARQTRLCRRAHPVNEENSIEVINLVLNCTRQKSSGFDFNRLTFQILRSDTN